ncbi:retinal Mueller cells isomerohydrolase-like [Littorina saxatilis]|uniref:Uncharacterized protein n=1 Tax=Littorina saxatilis TaxID=31220 RepID=A0AAN9AUY5_9CAEN
MATKGATAAKDGAPGAPNGNTTQRPKFDPSVTWLMFESEKETRTPVDTLVTGEIPEWCTGTLYRNGCGLFNVGEADTTHLFEGYAVLHRYDVKNGAVKYMSRILDREAWLKAVKARRTAVGEDGSTKEYDDPCMTTFAGTATYFKDGERENGTTEEDEESDKTGVNIVEHSDKLFALTESPILQEISKDTLQRKSKVDLQKILSVHMATAHPHFGRDGAMYNLGTAFAPPNNYNIIKLPPKSLETEDEISGKLKLVASVQSRWNFGLSYSHSFGMSEKHFIILEQPATLSTVKIMEQGANFKPTSVFRNFELHPKEKIRFYLISRRQGNRVVATQFLANPCFTFHFVNCYDDGDYVVVDLTSYDHMEIVNELMVSNVTSATDDIMTCTVRRYVLPLNIDKAPVGHNLPTLPYTTARAKVMAPGVVHLTPDYICKNKDKVYLELPRINYELCNGRKYRFVYGTAMLTKVHRLIKLDMQTRTPVYWQEEGYDPGEPVFVPRPGSKIEDEGVIMSPVISLRNSPDKPCFLLFLDARTFTEIARATTPPGVRIAMSFHGNFYAKT